MEEYAAKLLKLVLDKCQGTSFSEIRFISGMSPAFVDHAGPHFLEVAYLSSELVDEIHKLCLLLAEEKVTEGEAASTYAFELRRLGRVLCKYERRGNVASLVLLRDAEAESVDAVRPTKRPSKRKRT